VVATVALFEMGARSARERRTESALFRIGVAAARAQMLQGVPDLSVGPFQIRPSTAFGWRRERAWFGHVAIPHRGVQSDEAARCATLLSAERAMLHLLAILEVMNDGAVPCASLASAHERYRGGTSADDDKAVIELIHAALHAELQPS